MSSDEAFLAELARALQRAELEVLIVGSMAAALQGANVMTQDVDLLIRDTHLNRNRLARLCDALGCRAVRLSPLTETVSLAGLAVGVDVMFDCLPNGPRFEQLRARAIDVSLGDLIVKAASLEDVIAAKEAANRPKDRAQLDALRQTLAVRKRLAEEG